MDVMLLHNQPFKKEEQEQALKVPFHSLNLGERYISYKSVNLVYGYFDKYRVIKRADGWLITIKQDDYLWNKGVKKV